MQKRFQHILQVTLSRLLDNQSTYLLYCSESQYTKGEVGETHYSPCNVALIKDKFSSRSASNDSTFFFAASSSATSHASTTSINWNRQDNQRERRREHTCKEKRPASRRCDNHKPAISSCSSGENVFFSRSIACSTGDTFAA